MIWVLTLSFGASALFTLMVIASAHRHSKWSADHDLDGPQKMHAKIVPRVGGLGVAAGVVAGALAIGWLVPSLWRPVALLFVCAAPALGFGLIEDFTKSVSPRRRLVAAALSGLLGAWLLDAILVRSGWLWFDQVLAIRAVALVLTMFTVAGVVNSVNIIDGLNGLASMCVALMMAGICYIAFQVGDILVGGLALATLGAALGFFTWNYPRGLVFLGDGGAYLLGLMVIELGLMLVFRNRAVSPLAPLLVMAYPVFETLFTMYRRKVISGRPVSLPDGIHLHTLIYRRLLRWAVGNDDVAAVTRGNSMTSPYLWVLSSVGVVPACIWWDNTSMLALSIVAFVLIYLRLYWQIVRFKTPGWMSRVLGKD